MLEVAAGGSEVEVVLVALAIMKVVVEWRALSCTCWW